MQLEEILNHSEMLILYEIGIFILQIAWSLSFVPYPFQKLYVVLDIFFDLNGNSNALYSSFNILM